MADTYLENTSQGTPTSTKIGTISVWMKMNYQDGPSIISNFSDSSNRIYFRVLNTGQLYIFGKVGGSTNVQLQTVALLRDSSAWYHIVVAYDTTQVTDTDRIKLYINGGNYVWDAAGGTTYPAQDAVIRFNGEDNLNIGRRYDGTHKDPFDGYMTEFIFIDGTQYAASDFGETDSTSGIWVPKLAPSVTYGDNGYHLKFENSGASAAAGNFGSDSSGNDNHLTSYNLGSHPNTTDTPQNNFCTGNPLSNFYEQAVYTKGNLKVQSDTAGSSNAYTAMSANTALKAGKWYWEMYIDNEAAEISTGITPYITSSDTQWVGAQLYSYGYYTNGVLYNNSSSTAFGDSYTTGDTISFGVDLTNSKLYIAKNGVWQNSGDPAAGTNGFAIASVATVAASTSTTYPHVGGYQPSWSEQTSHTNSTISWNFGNPVSAITSSNADDAGYGNFEYDVPAGFYAVCTQNLATYG